jgi:hypothetical protein
LPRFRPRHCRRRHRRRSLLLARHPNPYRRRLPTNRATGSWRPDGGALCRDGAVTFIESSTLKRHDALDAEGAPCESLAEPLAETCVPMLSFEGGRGELRSRLRSAAALVVDHRQPIDLIRDGLEERGLALGRAA